MTDPQNPDVAAERPPYLLAGLVALGALVLYVLTLAPTTQLWDASEYITAAHALGIPHPPGSPLFVILAHAWGMLPLGVDYARRINLFAATTSAVAAGLWFLIGERWLRSIVSVAERRRLVAGAGAVVGATAFTVWNQSVVNEKVYTLSVLTIALMLWLVGGLVAALAQYALGNVPHQIVWVGAIGGLSGSNLLAFQIPAAVREGVYQLVITLQDESGTSKTYRATVAVPAP